MTTTIRESNHICLKRTTAVGKVLYRAISRAGSVADFPMHRRYILLVALPLALLVGAGSRFVGHKPFPPESTPEGAYVRIALMAAERRPRDAFPFLETEAQWACFTILDLRKKAAARVRTSYPPAERASLLDVWRDEADAPDGPDVFAALATRRGWIARLERDLSGVA